MSHADATDPAARNRSRRRRPTTAGRPLRWALLSLLLLPLPGCGSAAGADDAATDRGGAIDLGTADADQVDLAPLGEGVSTLAGAGSAGTADGVRGEARFNNPVNLAVGPEGALYVCDFDNGALRRVTAAGAVSTLVAGRAEFRRPFGIAFDDQGTLYVQTDYDTDGQLGGALWRVNVATGHPQLLLDRSGRARTIVPLPDGRLVLVDFFDHVIRLFDPDGGAPTLLAGTSGEPGFADGTGASARFDVPYDAVRAADGALIVADQKNNRLRAVTLAGEVTTLAGDGAAESVDGPLATARFAEPQALALAGQLLYVTDSAGYRIREVDLAGGTVATIAGDGVAGFRDGPAEQARFFGLEGLALDPASALLYVADGNRGEDGAYHRIRRLTLP